MKKKPHKRTSQDIHIEVLKFGRDNPGFTIQQLKEKFPDDIDWICKEIDHSKIFQTPARDIANPNRYYISFDDRFKLLEYEELNEARDSSKKAMIVAIISILLTFSGLVFNYVSLTKNFVDTQQTPPNTIDKPHTTDFPLKNL